MGYDLRVSTRASPCRHDTLQDAWNAMDTEQSAMSEPQAERTLNPDNEERRSLRKELRRAGWNVGTMAKAGAGVELVLWPVPHTGPAPGVEPRRVRGSDKTDALRNALNPQASAAAEAP